jgi:hypothetical protein
MGLSPEVETAVEEATKVMEGLVARILAGESVTAKQ